MPEPLYRPDAAPAPALWLGVAGLVPFVVLAFAAHLAPAALSAKAIYVLGAYGAIILSFMGGCRWGLACAGLGEGATWWALGVSTVPALLAWAALAVGGDAPLWVCALGLVALFAADVALSRAGGAPRWWPALRLPPTVGAVLSLLAATAA